jgi:hypothetical protein
MKQNGLVWNKQITIYFKVKIMIDSKKTIQEANGYFRNAEKNMFSGKNSEALEMLKKCEELTKEAASSSLTDPGIKTLFSKIEKMKKDLERKGIKISADDQNELPFEVQSHLSRIRALLISAAEQSYLLDQARKELDSYYRKFAGPMTNIPEINEINEHLERMEKERAAKNVAEKAEKDKKELIEKENDILCLRWYERLKSIPYFDGMPQNVNDLLLHMEYFLQADTLLNEYSTVQFMAQKSLMLENAESDLKDRVKEFPQKYNNTSNTLADFIVKKIEQIKNSLENYTEWEKDLSKMPNIIDQKNLSELQKNIEEIRPLFTDNSSGMEFVVESFKGLMELNNFHKKEKRHRIKLKPDALFGEDLSPVKEKSRQIVQSKYPESRILEIRVIKQWESKHMEDWEDTTKTKWVVRNILETVSQVAAIMENDQCLLFTLHIEKEVLNNGAYSGLTGHIMYSDEMAPENINA